MVSRLTYVIKFVGNMDQAVRFYREELGAECSVSG